MSKLCKGKYHGSGIKEIADNEKYCEICKQEIKLIRNHTRDVATVVVGVVLTIIGVFTGGRKLWEKKVK